MRDGDFAGHPPRGSIYVRAISRELCAVTVVTGDNGEAEVWLKPMEPVPEHHGPQWKGGPMRRKEAQAVSHPEPWE
jgi:hypothetical protein